jgi:plastocyanin
MTLGRLKKRVVAAAVGASVLVGSAGVALAATSTIRAKGERWRPFHTYIGRGDRVRWTNPTSRTHDVKAYGGGWSLSTVLSPGESVTKRFRQRGTYKYRCVRHSAVLGGQCQGSGLIHVS